MDKERLLELAGVKPLNEFGKPIASGEQFDIISNAIRSAYEDLRDRGIEDGQARRVIAQFLRNESKKMDYIK